jgi:hypothetical protein
MDAVRAALLEVLDENRDLAPGRAADLFHTQNATTHAASLLRLQSTGGYQLIAAGEGGPLLCPTWATHGSWNQGTHINLHRYLDASYAGPIHWETAVDRKAAEREPAKEPTTGVLASKERTNVTILLLQQPSVFWNW